LSTAWLAPLIPVTIPSSLSAEVQADYLAQSSRTWPKSQKIKKIQYTICKMKRGQHRKFNKPSRSLVWHLKDKQIVIPPQEFSFCLSMFFAVVIVAVRAEPSLSYLLLKDGALSQLSWEKHLKCVKNKFECNTNENRELKRTTDNNIMPFRFLYLILN